MKEFRLLPLAMLLLLSALPVRAQGGPKVAYQATYEMTSPGQPSMTNTSWSDGRGHTRTEQVVAGRKSATIIDFNAKVMYSVVDETKSVMKIPLNESAWKYDPDYMKRTGWQSLGAKVVEGHPCTGWQINTGGHLTQIWTGTDTDCTVLSLQDGKPNMRLLSFQRTNPPAALFSIPAGYKLMDMPDVSKFTAPGASGGQDWSKYVPQGQ
jgi:hypothetical protein